MRSPRPDDAAITGAGVVTALGYGLDASYEKLRAGESALRPTQDADTGAAASPAAILEEPLLRAEVPREMMAEIKFLNGAGELAVEATIEAMGAAALPEDVVPEMRGLYLSQMDSGDWSCSEFRPAVVAATEGLEKPLLGEALNEAAHRGRKTKPHFMLESLKNNAFSFLATMFGLRGANTSVAGFAGATQQAIDMGVRALARGGVDAAVVCGAARPTSGMARAEMKALHLAIPPGDGAATLVMERHAQADERGAKPMAVVLGLGAHTQRPAKEEWTVPTPALLAAASAALEQAGVEAGDLTGIVLPPIATQDLPDALASLPATRDVPLLRWQDQTGFLALAGDAADVAFAACALRDGQHRALLVLSGGLLGQAGAVVLG